MAFNIDVNTWIGLVNWHIDEVSDKKLASADLSWFNAKVSRVINQTEDMVEVQLHFGPNDGDNKKIWKLHQDDLVRATTQPFNLTPEIIARNVGKSQFAWRRYVSNPNRGTAFIRSLTKDEIIGILQHGFPSAFAKLTNLDLAETWQLVAILNCPTKIQSIPAVFKKPSGGGGGGTSSSKKRKAADAPGGSGSAGAAGAAGAAEDTEDSGGYAVVPRLENMVSVQEFKMYRQEMNTRFSNLEQMMNRVCRVVENFGQKTKKTAATVQVAVRNVSEDRKAVLFDQIKLNTVVPSNAPVFEKMWPHVRDGGKTFYGIANIARCVRYRHTNAEEVLCASSTFDKVVDGKTYFYHTVSAKKVPLAIMEVDKLLKDFVKNTASILQLKQAYDRWRDYRTCDACVSKMTGLHFVEEGAGFRCKNGATPNPIWEVCSICFLRRSNNKRFGDICPACEKCITKNNTNGGTDGGDDRSYAIKPVFYRFPWLTYTTNQDKRYAHLFSANSAVGGNPNSDPNLRGPDTVFFVKVPEVNKKVWILFEEDGDQHNDTNYTTESEINRVNRIRQTLLDTDTDKDRGDHVLLIRYAPLGVSKSASGLEYNLDKGIRLIIVRMWVCWFLKQVIADAPLAKTTVLYLFYNSDNRHLKRAYEEVKSGEFSVGYTHTFPQETHTAETENSAVLFDWRYCVHPEEGALVNELAKKHNLLFAKAKDVFQ